MPCLRGLLDTDGSIYKLKFGYQISFTNRSVRLLHHARMLMQNLGFTPSKPSGFSIYLTRQKDLLKYHHEIGFADEKRKRRLLQFIAGVRK